MSGILRINNKAIKLPGLLLASLMLFPVPRLTLAATATQPFSDPAMAPFFGGPSVCDDTTESDTTSATDTAEKYKNGRMAFLFGQYDIAYRIWQPLADEGYAKAQASLAWMYQTGKGATKNNQQAFFWYHRAAQQGHAIAQNNLGVFYEQGLGVTPNLQRAYEWYKKSADVGYSYAQYNLGTLLRDGRGTKKDLDEALYWLQIAALQGVKESQAALEALSKEARAKGIGTKHIPQQLTKLPAGLHGLDWIRAREPTHYTLQIARNDNLHLLVRFALQQKELEGERAYFHAPTQSTEWHYLILGDFKTRQEAQARIESLPTEVKNNVPYPRSFEEILTQIDESDQ